jgi:hypothetical protein
MKKALKKIIDILALIICIAFFIVFTMLVFAMVMFANGID